MRKSYIYFLLIWFTLPLFGLLALTKLPSSLDRRPPQQNAPTPAMPPSAPKKSWLILNLASNASQLEYGAEIYRLVCKACHGDKGQGLTDEWRATWAPEDQNCWKSKCHAANHPPDGFSMPAVPPVVGTAAMSRFYTAQDLQTFISTYMPWQDPGSLTEEEYWQVAAYILKLNAIDPGARLNAITAAQIRLGRTQQTVSSESSKLDGKNLYYLSALIIILVILPAGLLLYRRYMVRR
ncbi:MAG TPA: c-type cytochrome [Anaerolineales bacterium]|nr:c-type cytochrome [Anaerolineales bacterium]